MRIIRPSAAGALQFWVDRVTTGLTEPVPKVRFSFLILIAGGVVLLDQLTKAVVQASLFPGESVTVIPGFFNLTYVRNPGAAFGLLASGNPAVVIPFFVVLTIIIGIGILYYYKQSNPGQRAHRWGLSLILGGAAGNLIDRVRFQEVVDFLEFYAGDIYFPPIIPWPAFNIADTAISTGVGLLLLDMILRGNSRKRTKEEA